MTNKPPLTDAQLLDWYDKHKTSLASFYTKQDLTYDFLTVEEFVRLAVIKLREEIKSE